MIINSILTLILRIFWFVFRSSDSTICLMDGEVVDVLKERMVAYSINAPM